jgi:hypothetical protein
MKFLAVFYRSQVSEDTTTAKVLKKHHDPKEPELNV